MADRRRMGPAVGNGSRPAVRSGSTLIACARLLELDPKFCDVIVERWPEFTGKEATLEGNGRTFTEVQAQRIGGDRAMPVLPAKNLHAVQ